MLRDMFSEKFTPKDRSKFSSNNPDGTPLTSDRQFRFSGGSAVFVGGDTAIITFTQEVDVLYCQLLSSIWKSFNLDSVSRKKLNSVFKPFNSGEWFSIWQAFESNSFSWTSSLHHERDRESRSIAFPKLVVQILPCSVFN